MQRWRVCIPTRDSARWIGVFLAEYRRLGVEPLYIVDSRSKDETLAILQGRGAETAVITPRGDFVEAGMIEAACAASNSEWILRMDDDELPSAALLRWIENVGVHSIRAAWMVSRRDLFRHEGKIYYSRRRSAYHHVELPNYLAGHVRLHRTVGLQFSGQLHTSGLANLGPVGFAPEACFFVHCADLLLSRAQRLNKIRRYETIEAGSAWRFADEYLPELFDFAHLRPAQDGLDELAGFLNSLPLPDETAGLPINVRERELAQIETRKLGRLIDQYQARGAKHSTSDKIEYMKIFPRPLWRAISVVFYISGKVLRISSAVKFGKTIKSLYKYYRYI
jgi:glycosyltransferase involved in cell wall biosynthesis